MNGKPGVVLKTKKDLALVGTSADASPCDACASPCATRACAKTASIRLWARNEDGCAEGDKVVLQRRGGLPPLFSGLLCLIFPVAAAVGGYLAASGSKLAEGPSVAIAFAALALAAVIGTAVSGALSRRFPPYMARRAENPTEGSDTET